MELEDRCRHEIEELHQFFQDWFRGDVPATNDQFDRFASALGPGFRIVSPDGDCLDRDSILQIVRDRHQSVEDLAIEIRNVHVRQTRWGIAVVMYEEWHKYDGEHRGRLSTAVLEVDTKDPEHVCWWHVHETWLPE